MSKHKGIDFDKLFLKGHKSYDSAIGDWWDGQASNGSHRKAYASVAEYVEKLSPKSGPRKPKWIVDYACGSGHFLASLAVQFPNANIVALDGSRKMLEQARLRMEMIGEDAGVVSAKLSFAARGPRIRLVQTSLPNFSLPKWKADIVVFLFPNLTPAPGDQPYYDRHGYKILADTKVAKVLARLREMDPEDEVDSTKPEEMFDGLMTDRVISRNLRYLLRPKGVCFKVDYANADRDELSHLTRLRSLFVEGALEEPVKDLRCPTFFRYRTNRFKRSQVILDVFHQTKDPTDKHGGYFISVFDAK